VPAENDAMQNTRLKVDFKAAMIPTAICSPPAAPAGQFFNLICHEKDSCFQNH
jgi:hypothetical protein